MARFYAYRTTFHDEKGNSVEGAYPILHTIYHIEFNCRNGNGAKTVTTEDPKTFNREVGNALGRGFFPADEVPREVPTMQRFSKPKTIEGITKPVKLILNTPVKSLLKLPE